MSTILYDVRIGSNVIIGSGSLVNKDIPDNCVAAGVPAKVIGSIEDFMKKRSQEGAFPDGMKPVLGRCVPDDLAQYCWEQFEVKRSK